MAPYANGDGAVFYDSAREARHIQHANRYRKITEGSANRNTIPSTVCRSGRVRTALVFLVFHVSVLHLVVNAYTRYQMGNETN